MKDIPQRVLLDTNIFIIGYLDPDSPESRLLDTFATTSSTILIFSNELEEQIRRVGKRLRHKDWVGQLLNHIWRNYQIEYVYITLEEIHELEGITDIPREDIGIYLTALRGKADCLISANHQLVKDAAAKQNVFACFDAERFIAMYLS